MIEERGAVLVVDDDAEMRELVSDVLKERGHQTTTAGSGQEALKLLAEQYFAVVLTDLRMKGMLGTELLNEIKRLYPDMGVILMTAFGSVETAVDAMKQGASDYLTKPVKTEEIIRVVERAVRESALTGSQPPAEGSPQGIQLSSHSGEEQGDSGSVRSDSSCGRWSDRRADHRRKRNGERNWSPKRSIIIATGRTPRLLARDLARTA